MTRYLVTGGTGFLGRHLVKALVEAGREVRVLHRPSSDTTGLPDVELMPGDVCERADLERALDGVGRVFHLAAELRDGQPAELYDRVNHRAVTTLLELAGAREIERLVHTSHYFTIGRSGEPRSPPDFVNDEYWTHDPSDMHDAHEQSKYDAENSLNQRVSLSEPVLALIPTMTYGPELRPVSRPDDLRPANRIVRMLAEHAAGHYPGIPGDGRQVWNLVHVEDVARAHLRVMEAGEPGDGRWPPTRWTHWHYLCGGENVSVNALFEAFAQATGVAPPEHVSRQGGRLARWLGRSPPDGGRSPERFAMDSHCWAFRSEMAEREWGYTHRPFAEGLEQTVAWMRSSHLLG